MNYFYVFNINTYIKIRDIKKQNCFVNIQFLIKLLEILIICFGIIIGLATYISHGILLKTLFFTFLGYLGWDFGMRFLNDDDDDDDFDVGKMIPILQRN